MSTTAEPGHDATDTASQASLHLKLEVVVIPVADVGRAQAFYEGLGWRLDGAHVLSEIVQRVEARGVTVLIKGVREGHVELFRTVGVLAALRHDNHLFSDLDPAIHHARSHIVRENA